MDESTRRLNTSLTRHLLLMAAGSFAFGFALVPLYDVICEIAADPSPALRYQSSEQSRAIAAQKLVDPTGRTILAATRTMLHPG